MTTVDYVLEDFEPELCNYLLRQLAVGNIRMLRHEVRVQLWVERQREANDHYLRGLFAEFLRRHRCGRRRHHHPMHSYFLGLPQATPYRPNPDWRWKG